jgi:Laminin EGF domain
MIAGGLSIMFNKGSSPKSNKACLEGACLLGRHEEKNSVTLHSVFTEGEYLISIFYKLEREDKELLDAIGGIDYTMHINLSPLMQKEDRFNCDAGRLPPDLNIIMDSDGFLRYNDRVFADFSEAKQITSVELTRKSVIRVTSIEPAGINADLLLKKSGNIVCETNVVGGVEGLLKEINPGNYTLEVSFINSFIEDTRHKFCETIILEIGISPVAAVADFVDYYKLAACENSRQGLADRFKGFKAVLKTAEVQIEPTSVYYTMPIRDLAVGEEEIFRGEFEIPGLVYSHFEIFSDFVLGDLFIRLEKSTGAGFEVFRGTSNALEIGQHGRKSFNGVLKEGRYFFVIKTGPTARLASDNELGRYYNTDKEYLVVPHCVPFQLRISLVPSTEEKIDKWECKGKDIKYLPSTLNTIDRLGIQNTPSSFLPSSVLHLPSVLGPNSHISVFDSLSFFIERESLIKVIIETEETPMLINLKIGDRIITSDGDQNTRTPYIYSVSALLSQHTSYKLEMFFYKINEKCNTYSILLEIIPASRLKSTEKCFENYPNESFIAERLLGTADLFEMIGEDGYSSIKSEPKFYYKQGSVPYKISIPLVVTMESVLITGHLLQNFIKSGLIIQIENERVPIEWGRYKSPYRYELDPIPLTTGTYELIIKEITDPIIYNCAEYTGTVLMEDVGYWEDVTSMIKKTETCNYPDRPESLNLIGELESNTVHLHQTLPVDSIFKQTLLMFNIDVQSVVGVYIMPMKDIDFSVNINMFDLDNPIVTGTVKITAILDPGRYLLQIKYDSELGLPSDRLCPRFEIDLSILPVSDYKQLSSQYTCEASQIFPETLAESLISRYLVYGPIDKELSINALRNSELDIFVSFETILAGYVRLELYDSGHKLLEESIGNVDWTMLKAAVPSGSYLLRIVSDGSLDSNCWPLAVSYTHRDSEPCPGAILPPSLLEKESVPYGGPQELDGSISFHGTFKIPQENPKEVLKIYAHKPCLVRVSTSVSGQFRIESSVYRESFFNIPLAYSKNKSKYSSFIFELPEQDSPYFIVFSHIIETPELCMTYDLKIAILPRDSLQSLLECKINSHESLLPPLYMDLSESNTFGGDQYAIVDKWMIGKDLPPGIVSHGKKNTMFVYETTLKVVKNGLVSLETNYDYLTNDIIIEVYKGKKLIGSSIWEVVSDDELGDIENFSSVIEDLELHPGTYTVKLQQGISSNHLIQRYPHTSICFPFSFFLEFIESSDTPKNQLLLANPSHKTHHNILQPLSISLKFQHPLDITSFVVYLKSSELKVYPQKVAQNQSFLSKVSLNFKSSLLLPGRCYELVIESEFLTQGPVKHEYCTWDCICNPKSHAQCIESKCLCPSPYAGNECFNCNEGYILENNYCSVVADNDPQILSARFSQDHITKSSPNIKLFIVLSSAPYSSQGERISNENFDILLNAFTLVSNSTKTKPVTAAALVEDLTKWVLKYNIQNGLTGKVYKLNVEPKLVYSSTGKEFRKDLEDLTFSFESDNAKIVCSGHGIKKSLRCACETGYSGDDCSICDQGYIMSQDKTCETLTKPYEIDADAFIKRIYPSELMSMIQKEKISLELELSKEAYTNKGYIIYYLINYQYIQNAFFIKSQESETMIFPSSIQSTDEKGLNWSINFSTDSLEPGFSYKFHIKPEYLYTSQGKFFDTSKTPFTNYQVIKDLRCKFGKQVRNECVCDLAYKGKYCDECKDGYYTSLQGECIKMLSVLRIENQDITLEFTLAYYMIYAVIIGIVFFIIKNLRKTERPQRNEIAESELEEIDLFK